jgi:hypothetical protein
MSKTVTKELIAFTPEIDCDQMAMGLPSLVFLIIIIRLNVPAAEAQAFLMDYT